MILLKLNNFVRFYLPNTLFPLNKLSKLARIAAKLKSTFILLATITVSFMYFGK